MHGLAVLWLAVAVLPGLAASPPPAVEAIVIADNASNPVRFAAEKLAGLLGAMSGKALPVARETGHPSPAVFVGPVRAMPESVRRWLDDQKPLAGAAAVEVTGRGDVFIAGPFDRATWWAVGEFLCEEGFRWYLPHRFGMEYPTGHALAFKPRSVRHVSPFEFRGGPWGGLDPGEDKDWLALNGLWIGHNVPEVNARYGPGFGTAGNGHQEDFFLSDALFKAHPEYFALVNGKRMRTHFEYTRPEMVDLTVQKILEDIRKAQTAPIRQYVFGMADRSQFSESPEARAFGTVSDNVFAYVQKVADGVTKEHPEVKIHTLAYSDHFEPPTKVRLKDNVVVWVTLWHTLGVKKNVPATDPIRSARFSQLLRAWQQAAPGGLFVYTYWGDYASFTPFPQVHNICYDVPRFAKSGVIGLINEAHPHWGTNALEMWTMVRMMWDPRQTQTALTDEWCRGFWGPATEPMQHFYSYLQDRFLQEKGVGRGTLSPAVMAQGQQWISQAGEKLRGAPERFQWRYRLTRAGWDYSVKYCQAMNYLDEVKKKQWKPGVRSGDLRKDFERAIRDLKEVDAFFDTPFGRQVFKNAIAKHQTQQAIRMLRFDPGQVPSGDSMFEEGFDKGGGLAAVWAESVSGFEPLSASGLGLRMGRTGQITYHFRTENPGDVFRKARMSFLHFYNPGAATASAVGNAIQASTDGRHWITVAKNRDFKKALLDLDAQAAGRREFWLRFQATADRNMPLVLDAFVLNLACEKKETK